MQTRRCSRKPASLTRLDVALEIEYVLVVRFLQASWIFVWVFPELMPHMLADTSLVASVGFLSDVHEELFTHYIISWNP